MTPLTQGGGGGESQAGQGASHVCVGQHEKKETPQHHSRVCCPAHPLRNVNVSMGNSLQKGGDGARSAGPKKWGGREAMASVELRWRLGWCGLRGACRGSGFASLIPGSNIFFDPGSGETFDFWIRYKHPGSAKLVKTFWHILIRNTSFA